MANENKPFGLRTVQSLIAGVVSGKVRQYKVDAADGSASIFIGDVVKLAGGNGNLYGDEASYPTVAAAALGDAMVGVVVDIVPVPGSLEVNHVPGSTDGYVLVESDPNAVFEMQGDANPFVPTVVGLNASIAFTPGNDVTGRSAFVVNQGTVAPDVLLDVSIIGTSPRVGNDLSGAYPLLLVRLNNHQYVDGTTGV